MIPVFALLLLSTRSHTLSTRRPGFAIGLFLAVYGPFRFLLDRLHESPPHWFFLTIDQWSGAAATLLGLAILSLRPVRKTCVAWSPAGLPEH
jgi:prolipoprotein diacylglyceryltransferase